MADVPEGFRAGDAVAVPAARLDSDVAVPAAIAVAVPVARFAGLARL